MHISVISLNIWEGGNLFPAALDFIKSQNADIVLLQEVNNSHDPSLSPNMRTMDELNRELDYIYSKFSASMIVSRKQGDVPHGLAILSRYPITSSSSSYLIEPRKEKFEDIPEDWKICPRILQHIKIDIEGKEINVFNFHGVWDLAGDSFSLDRQRMLKVILETTDGLSNVILAGDSNTTTGNDFRRPLEQSFTDVVGKNIVSTFNMKHKTDPGYATAAVDVLYVSPDIKIISKDIPQVDVSDHLPIVAELEVV